ncbi:secondary thiamine-phosphate synthase [Lachnoclostridium sp. An14]|uniref:secondary thiamine-phosphate synthase enzyme YjbQ n=1 Tax=Lachnoclostridium sp. An14 TaxID=1965562 RepID=UPI000B390BFD|nr:secondary thiamine-phosphate synthase enzyme YjbQ [Lachnoclostridium sp. An14]OUQ19361.1 secondary thiamine-phosphate synthase [Lachnoclostridium sp. An14]
MFRREYIETEWRGCPSITGKLEELVKESGIQEGLCVVSAPDLTTALGITSFWDKRGLEDLMDELDRDFPARVDYKSQRTPFDSVGNVKGAVVGRSLSLIIHEGKLVLGSSQGVVLLEFDGPRRRPYEVQLVERSLTLYKTGIKTQYMGMCGITDWVRSCVKESGVKEGLCHVSQLHSTAGILLCGRSEPAKADLMADIERMVPTRADFKHRETASDAGGHVKTALTGSQISLAVHHGELVIGEDQDLVFAEFDGPRPRTVYAAVMGEKM